MRTLLTFFMALVMAAAMPEAAAGTVLTYGYASGKPPKMVDESATADFVVEVQDGKLRWYETGYEDEEWAIFDPEAQVIREYIAEKREYHEYDDHDEFADPDVAVTVQRTVPKRLGKTRRNGHACVMYSHDDQGMEKKTCLADASAFGIPPEDAAALQALADFVHRLRDLELYTSIMPLSFSTVSGIGVWDDNSLLIKVEQRDLPRERFETPPDYKRYEPEIYDEM